MVDEQQDSAVIAPGWLDGKAMLAAIKPTLKKAARQLEKSGRKVVFAALSAAAGRRQETSVTALQEVSRIIVIRPNFRIGNAILSTAIIAPLQERFPGATIDFLVTDKTASLFANLPIGYITTVSRSVMRQPWRALPIVRELRARRYDLAVQLAPSSLSGLVVSSLVGARYIMGKPKGSAAWYDITVKDPIVHAYDVGTAFSRTLGTIGPANTCLAISDEERARAFDQFQAMGLEADDNGNLDAFVAVFVGGHADKVCPVSFWLALINDLNRAGKRFIVFVGPEEKAMIPRLQQALETLPLGSLCPPQPLRLFAAMLAQARVMVTPDSGPMHMAAALGVPVVMMLQAQKSMGFVPPCAGSRVVPYLNVSQVLVAVDGHYNNNAGDEITNVIEADWLRVKASDRLASDSGMPVEMAL